MDWNINKIEELAQLITQYGLTEVEIRNGDLHISVKKAPAIVEMLPWSQGIPVTGNQQSMNTDFRRITEKKTYQDDFQTYKATQKECSAKNNTVRSTDNKKYLTSPIAGIFYRRSQPGNPPYVEIGQSVKKGDTVCLVEAMKMINEIQADRDGVIKEFLVEDEQFVEYGTPLVLIEEE